MAFLMSLLVPGLVTALGDFSGILIGFISALFGLFGGAAVAGV